jgi:hypothetical protein
MLMRVEHLAIDGSVVSIEADGDLSTQATASGWAIVPSLMRAHPFSTYPVGHSQTVEKMVRSNFPDINIESIEEYSLKGGKLRIAAVNMQTATEGRRSLVVGAWEGKKGCLTTSLIGSDCERLVEVFDTLQFGERSRGVVIDSPVTPRPRAPEVIKEIPGLGVMGIRPAIPSTLDRVPKSKGFATNHGELFRFRASSNTLLFVGDTVVARIDALAKAGPAEAGSQKSAKKKAGAKREKRMDEADQQEMQMQEALAIAQSLRVEWVPRGSHQ